MIYLGSELAFKIIYLEGSIYTVTAFTNLKYHPALSKYQFSYQTLFKLPIYLETKGVR